jgi:Transposase DDE domain
VVRRLYHKQVVDGFYQLDEGALRDDFFDFMHELGVSDWLGEVQGIAVQREMVPFVQYPLLYSLKTLLGIESMPALLFIDQFLMRLVGFSAYQVQHGVCQRGAARRQGPRTTGPIGPDALADTIGQLNLRHLEGWCNGVIRPLATAGVFGVKVTGIVDATDVETTAQYEGCGQVTRTRKLTDTRGKAHAIAVTVYGWRLMVLIDARSKIPLAVKVVPIHTHETLFLRPLVTQARTNLADHVHLDTVVFDPGFLEGADLWWLAQHDILCVGPAKGEHGGDRGCPGPNGGRRRDYRPPPGAYRPPWLWQNGLDRRARARGRGDSRSGQR